MSARHFFVHTPERLREVLGVLRGLEVSKKKPLEIVVREPARDKSDAQRKLWHAMMDDIARQMGHTPGEMKQIVKAEYFGTERIKLPSGHVVEVVQSSEDEGRDGYSRLIDFTIRLASENGIVIQDQRTFTT